MPARLALTDGRRHEQREAVDAADLDRCGRGARARPRQTGPAPSASRPSTPPTGPASRRRTTRLTPSSASWSRTARRSWRTGRPPRTARAASPSSTAPYAPEARLTRTDADGDVSMGVGGSLGGHHPLRDAVRHRPLPRCGRGGGAGGGLAAGLRVGSAPGRTGPGETLTPIAGLERHLHRLPADARLALRAVRAAVLESNREGRTA